MTRFASLRQTALSAVGALFVSGLFVAAAVAPASGAAAATLLHL